MPRKTLRVQVELDIQAVTCPGVWLCPNGKVSLQVCMLDSSVSTTGLQPVFPLLYHEKFVFYKNFHTAYSLSELQRFMKREFLYAELIQWQNCDIGNVIASFQTSLCDVLYPTTSEGAIAGVDIDLLMEPSKHFPGIIAPKIEISTRTTVEEILLSNDQRKLNAFVINPKTILSNQCPCGSRPKQIRQQKVCHSVGYHKSRRCPRTRRSIKPPFVYRKPEEELLTRKPGYGNESTNEKCKCCTCCQNTSSLLDDNRDLYLQPQFDKAYGKISNQYSKAANVKRRNSPKKTKRCSCGSGHAQESCPVCAKYRFYFEGGECDCPSPTRMAGGGFRRSKIRDSFARRLTTSSPIRDRKRELSRSPVKTVGREQECPSKSTPHTYSSPRLPRATFDFDGQEAKVCDCTSPSNDDKSSKKTCFYGTPKKPSLAEQIHFRLRQSLDYMPAYPFVSCTHEPDSASVSLCSCPKFRNCKEGFYKNLGRFYSDLRRC